ncbi:hypothetical protein CRG98_004295, partial [Punica granatum]
MSARAHSTSHFKSLISRMLLACSSGDPRSTQLEPFPRPCTKGSSSSRMVGSLRSRVKRTTPSTRKRLSPILASEATRTFHSIHLRPSLSFGDYGEIRSSRADRMVGKVLLRHNYVPGTLDGPFSALEDEPVDLSAICAVTDETPLGVHIRLAQENEELNNWTSVPRYSVEIADVLYSNPNHRQVDSNSSEEHIEESRPIYFGEGLDEDSRMLEIEESLRRLEDRQFTSIEPTEEFN